MTNPVQPVPCKILSVVQESETEWTFRVETDVRPQCGQFMQLSIPMVGEAPISVSAQGDGWVEFTIRSVGKVTNVIFQKEPGDLLFLRGPYGKGWPLEQFRDKHMVVITGGTGLAPVRSGASPWWLALRTRAASCSGRSWRRGAPPSVPSTLWTRARRRAGALAL